MENSDDVMRIGKDFRDGAEVVHRSLRIRWQGASTNRRTFAEKEEMHYHCSNAVQISRSFSADPFPTPEKVYRYDMLFCAKMQYGVAYRLKHPDHKVLDREDAL